MKMTVKGGLATLVLAASASLATAAYAESYNNFSFGSNEAYLIQHCTYNACNIDYTRMPNWPSNPMYRQPSISVYEYPAYYDDEGYAPEGYEPEGLPEGYAPPPEEEYPYEDE